MLPEKIYSAEQARDIDRETEKISNYGDGALMERAGRAAFRALQHIWPKARTIVVCCGVGNNGGDGYVLADLAVRSGMRVSLISVGEPRTEPSKQVWRRSIQSGLKPQGFELNLLKDADVIVDAIIGVGLSRTIEGKTYQLIENINQCKKPVLSLDVPSGLNANTGAITGAAVLATATITFICLKAGLVTGDGVDHSGRLLFESLGLPSSLFSKFDPIGSVITEQRIGTTIGKLKSPRHKGDAGHLIVIGGNVGMSGAARLAAESALRVGAGLVTVATVPEHVPYLNLGCPELMVCGVSDGERLSRALENATGVVIGPGLGKDRWAMDLLSRVLEIKLPIVVDADALNLLAHHPSVMRQWILTPHPGEAARLLKTTTSIIQSDRLSAVSRIQKAFGGVCVLKGAGSLVADTKTDIGICIAGNSGMASAGMGDVLAGVVGSLLAQGLNIDDAALAGTWLHSTAGDLAAVDGMRGMIARDLFPYLRRLMPDHAVRKM